MEQPPRLDAKTSRSTEAIKQSPQDIYCAFRATARQYSNRPALAHPAVRYTYGELMHRIEKLAGALSRRGVHRGDRIALLMPNSPQLVESFFALLRLGAAAVFSPLLQSPQQMLAFLQKAQIKGMIVSDGQAAHLEGIRHRHVLDPVILAATVDNAGAGARMISPLLRKMGGTPSVAQTAKDNGAERLKKIIKENVPPPQRQIISPTETVALFYDPDSTEPDPMVTMDHTVLYAGQRTMAELMRQETADVVLDASPLGSAFSLTTGLLTPMLGGACLALPSANNPKAVFDACRRLGVTVLLGLSANLAEAASHHSVKRRADRLRLVMAEGAPLDNALAEKLTKLCGKKPRAMLGHRRAAGAFAGARGEGRSFALLPGVEVEMRRAQQTESLWARGENIAGEWIDTGLRDVDTSDGRITMGGRRRAQVA